MTVPTVSSVHVTKHAVVTARFAALHHAVCAGVWIHAENLTAVSTSDAAYVRSTCVTGSCLVVLRRCHDRLAKLVDMSSLCRAVLTPAMKTCYVIVELLSGLIHSLACLHHNACKMSTPDVHALKHFSTRRIHYTSGVILTPCDRKEHMPPSCSKSRSLSLGSRSLSLGSQSLSQGSHSRCGHKQYISNASCMHLMSLLPNRSMRLS